MRHILLAGALLAGLSGFAQAADLSYPAATTGEGPMVTPTFNWAGPFLGINGGPAFGTSSWTSGGLTTGPYNVSGGMIGATAGYSIQSGPWVYGLIGDIDWANLSGRTPNFCFTNCATSSDWLGTVRGRIGFAKGAFLPYLTGGLAVGNISAHFVDNSSGAANSTATGWTAGVGAEFAIKQGWSLTAEALYVDLGSITCPTTVCIGPGIPATVPLTETVLRLGLNRHF
jgi:outer membrane immunogenic protein